VSCSVDENVAMDIIADIMLSERERQRNAPRADGKRPVGRPRGQRVQHLRREPLSERHPAHVTLRFLPHVWGLRSRRAFKRIEKALREFRKVDDARVVHYAVLGNHIHMIVEAPNRVRLARCIQGFEVRLARALNNMMERRGKVFADRYHAHVLRTPREAHHAIGYVLRNAAKHFRGRYTTSLDPYSSAATFAGWTVPMRVTWSPISPGDPLVADPKSWLLRIGWRDLGLIDPKIVPGSLPALPR
jgi:putative transposase